MKYSTKGCYLLTSNSGYFSISPDKTQLEKGKETEIHLDVNDKDLYEDANRMREENEEIEENESQERPRGFRR